MKPGMSFRPADTRPAGHVFYIPETERPDDDIKNRPHYLLHRTVPIPGEFVLATLAHMTTKGTEGKAYGAPLYRVEDDSGLTRPEQEGIFVSGVRLIPRDVLLLTRSAHVAGEAAAARRIVRDGLGIGTGLPREGSKSIRGRLVRLALPTARKAGFEYAIVLTQHEYSARRRWQALAPVVDMMVEGEEGPEELIPGEHDVVPERQTWWAGVPFEQPMIETAALVTLSEPWRGGRDRRRWLTRQIAEVTRYTIDPATLAAVERAVVLRLSLPEPEGQAS